MEETLKGMVIGAALMLTLVACTAARVAAALYCDVAKPIYLEDNDIQLARDGILSLGLVNGVNYINSKGVKLCGWRI